MVASAALLIIWMSTDLQASLSISQAALADFTRGMTAIGARRIPQAIERALEATFKDAERRFSAKAVSRSAIPELYGLLAEQ